MESGVSGQRPDRQLVSAARRLLSECLQMSNGNELVIFVDETTQHLLAPVYRAAAELRLSARAFDISTAEQRDISRSSEPTLHAEWPEAMEQADAIISLLSGDPECTEFRSLLLRTGSGDGRRFAHIPGASAEAIAFAENVDFKAAASACDRLTMALSLGDEAELTTYAFDGPKIRAEYKLKLRLGGLSRPAISSPGIIASGSWGNVPGGEAFIAPIEYVAEGEFALSGSFTGTVLGPNESIILTFRNGRLTGISATDPVKDAFKAMINRLRFIDPDHYNLIAELGIGVNEGIRHLRGDPVFDEKCAGTAHIALGSNYGYGGTITSRVHEDLVTRAPTLSIDAKQVLRRGANVVDESLWVQSASKNLDLTWLSRISQNLSTWGQIDNQEDFRIYRTVSSGRICTYPIRYEKGGKVLQTCYDIAPPAGNSETLGQLALRLDPILGIEGEQVLHAFRTLAGHGALIVSEQ